MTYPVHIAQWVGIFEDHGSGALNRIICVMFPAGATQIPTLHMNVRNGPIIDPSAWRSDVC